MSRVVPAPPRRRVIASFPEVSASTNPYQRLLYESLHDLGFRLAPPARLRFRWLWNSREAVGCLHFHWLTPYYHHDTSAGRLARLLLLGARLKVARMLGYRIVWTVHEIDPHVRRSWADRIAPHVVSRFASRLIVHDESTRRKVMTRLHRSPTVIPHGSFADVYPSGRARAEVRQEIGVTEDTALVLLFGHVSHYKSVDSVVPALRLIPPGQQVAVLVAGRAMDDDVAATLRAAAEEEDRLRLWLRFIPDEEVAPLFQACDVAVVTRVDDGTSGVLVLALSFGVPVIVADTPGYRSLTAQAGARYWCFAPGDPASLAAAITTAANDLKTDGGPGLSASTAGPDWSEVATRTAAVLAPEAYGDCFLGQAETSER